MVISSSADETLHYLRDLTESRRIEIGLKARERVLNGHTHHDRARELEEIYSAARASKPPHAVGPQARPLSLVHS